MNLLKIAEDITKQELYENIGQVVTLNYSNALDGCTEYRRDVCGVLHYNNQTDRYTVYNVNADDDSSFTVDNVKEVEYSRGVLKIILL